MKKFLSIFICVLMLFSSVFGVACGGNTAGAGNDHTCVYNDIKFDAENHWNECSCGKTISIEKHSFTKGKCACGYTDPTYVEPEKPSNPSNPSNPIFPKPNETETVLRFAVTSDIHYRENGAMESGNRLASVYETAYDYAESQTDYNKLDGIFFVGDQTENGKEVEQKAFYKYVEENTKEGTVARAVMGNHEYYATGTNGEGSTGAYKDASMAQAPLNFMEYTGYDDDDAHLVTNGYHFILLSLDKYGWDTGKGYEYMSSTKLNWLKGELNKALADDPTGEKPIFVFHHIAPQNTMIGSAGADKNMKALLDNYPNVVDFSGHTHRPISDPRSIWQGTFTALQTGSMAYLNPYVAGHPTHDESGAIVVDENGSFYKGDNLQAMRNATMYYVCELDSNNVLTVKIMNTLTKSIWGEPYVIDSFGDVSGFDYTDARKDSSPAPTFKGSDAITVKSNVYSNVEVIFPQATCKDLVQNYRLDIYESQTLVKSEYRLSGNFYGDLMPKNMTFTFGGLKESTTYTLKAYPVNSWGVEGAPLTTEFTTSAYSATATADLFSVKFNDDGTATDAVTNTALRIVGAPAVSDGIATFDGDDAYIFEDSREWYSVLKDGFTMETYVYINAKTSSTQATGANTHSGGFGMSVNKGNYRFYFNDSKGSKKVETAVSAGTWIHVLGVFDGTNISIYLNGVQKATLATNGVYAPANNNAQCFVVGADSGSDNSAEFFLKGKIKAVNIYSGALTQEQITNLYNGYSN